MKVRTDSVSGLTFRKLNTTTDDRVYGITSY